MMPSTTLACPSKSMKPRSVAYQQPSKPIITFSFTPSYDLEFTDSSLRYYSEPPVGTNLNYGYDKWKGFDDEGGRIDSLLRAVVEVTRRNGELSQIGVISWRTIITKMFTAPYEKRYGWKMNVMNVSGTLYLEEHITKAQILQEKNNLGAKQRLHMYYACAFNQFSTSEVPPSGAHDTVRAAPAPTDVPIGWSDNFNQNIQWYTVVQTKLDDVNIIMGGMVDCVREKYTGEMDTCVKLKTSPAIRNRHQEMLFERKLLDYYFQSFVLGVPEIIVGFRTPAGTISAVQSFKTLELPGLVQGKPGAWDPIVSRDWVYQVLTFLKGLLPDQAGTSSTARVHRVTFVPGTGIQVEELNATGIQEVENGEDRFGFLPRWYWNEVNKTGDGDGAGAGVKSAKIGGSVF